MSKKLEYNRGSPTTFAKTSFTGDTVAIAG
jgi:hypothetical protein